MTFVSTGTFVVAHQARRGSRCLGVWVKIGQVGEWAAVGQGLLLRYLRCRTECFVNLC
jgi:hypothetical protein